MGMLYLRKNPDLCISRSSSENYPLPPTEHPLGSEREDQAASRALRIFSCFWDTDIINIHFSPFIQIVTQKCADMCPLQTHVTRSLALCGPVLSKKLAGTSWFLIEVLGYFLTSHFTEGRDDVWPSPAPPRENWHRPHFCIFSLLSSRNNYSPFTFSIQGCVLIPIHLCLGQNWRVVN